MGRADVISIRQAYAPPIVAAPKTPRRRTLRHPAVGSSLLARTLAVTYGGDGDVQLARLMRISADDGDDRQVRALRVLLSSMKVTR